MSQCIHLRPLLAPLLAGCLGLAVVPAEASGSAFKLSCKLIVPATVRAGQPVPLRFELTNESAQAVQVLIWNTPFEGAWFGAYMKVRRDGKPLEFQGPMVKRGEPKREEYLALAAHETKSATLDLALPYDLAVPGRYEVAMDGTLHDVAPAKGHLPRPFSRHQGQPLACGPVDFVVQSL